METAKDWTDFLFLLFSTLWIFTAVKLRLRSSGTLQHQSPTKRPPATGPEWRKAKPLTRSPDRASSRIRELASSMRGVRLP